MTGKMYAGPEIEKLLARYATEHQALPNINPHKTFLGFDVYIDPAMAADAVEFRDPKTGAVLARMKLQTGRD